MARPNNRNRRNFRKEPKEFEEKVIEIKRLSKKTKGGNKISFSALVVIGNRKGRIGVGLDKAKDVMSAIQKAIKVAKKKLVTVNIVDGTIPHEMTYSKGSSLIILKPAPEGTGVIAGGSIRAVVEAAGIKNIVTKSLGSKNKTLNVKCTFEALKSMKSIPTKSKEQIVKDIKEDSALQKKKQPKFKAINTSKPKIAKKAPVKKETTQK